MTASIHNSILVPLAGDYDGDTLNIVSIKDAEMRKKFEETFSPKNMLISSNSGKFNNEFAFKHDVMLGGDILLS